MADLEASEAELLKTYIKQVLDESQNPNAAIPQAAPEPEPVKMNLGGTDFQFKDMKEAEAKFNEFLAQAQSQIQAAQTPKPAPVQGPTGNDAPGFQMDKYAELMTSGKVTDGLEYALQHTPMFKQTMQQTQQLGATVAVYQFKEKHPEVQKMPQAGQAIEQIRQQFNIPFTADGLDAAYSIAVSRGMLVPPAAQPQAPPPPPQVQQGYNPYLAPNGGIAPPPQVTRSGDNSSAYDTEEAVENMSLDQLKSYMKKLDPNRR